MLSFPHLVVLFVIALIIFGPQKLPELARMLGKATAEFRKMTNDFRYALEDEVRDMERQTRIREEEAAATARASQPQPQPGQTPPEGTVQRILPAGDVPGESGEANFEADETASGIMNENSAAFSDDSAAYSDESAPHADPEPAPSAPQQAVTAPQEKPSDDK